MDQKEFNAVVARVLEMLLDEILHRDTWDIDAIKDRIRDLQVAFPEL